MVSEYNGQDNVTGYTVKEWKRITGQDTAKPTQKSIKRKVAQVRAEKAEWREGEGRVLHEALRDVAKQVYNVDIPVKSKRLRKKHDAEIL